MKALHAIVKILWFYFIGRGFGRRTASKIYLSTHPTTFSFKTCTNIFPFKINDKRDL